MLLQISVFHLYGWIVTLRREWKTGKPGVLQSMGLQRVRRDLATEQKQEYYIVYMYHIFLIHSSGDGHLDSFHVLAAVNSAVMNIRMHVSFWIRVLSVYAGFLDRWVILFFVFWGTSILSWIMAAPIYIPTNSVGGFPSLLSSIYYLWTFNGGHSKWCEVKLIGVLICISLIAMLSIFWYTFWSSVCLLWRNFYSGLLLRFWLGYFLLLLLLSCMNCLNILKINPLLVI